MESVAKKWMPIFIAVVTGLLTLVGYILPQTLMGSIRDRLVEGAVIVGAFAFVLALFNVISVHSTRIFNLKSGWVYSLVLLLAALVSWIPPVIGGPFQPATEQLLNYVIAPLGASLAALVVFALTLAGFRLLRNRRSPWSLLFIAVVTFTLLGTAPIRGLEWLGEIRSWLIAIPGTAGVRGLLLGVALGTLITGLRVLLTQDRPYSEF